MHRRDILKTSINALPFAVVSSALARPTWANEAPAMANDFWLRSRMLRLRRDGELLESTYWIDGEIQTEAW